MLTCFYLTSAIFVLLYVLRFAGCFVDYEYYCRVLCNGTGGHRLHSRWVLAFVWYFTSYLPGQNTAAEKGCEDHKLLAAEGRGRYDGTQITMEEALQLCESLSSLRTRYLVVTMVMILSCATAWSLSSYWGRTLHNMHLISIAKQMQAPATEVVVIGTPVISSGGPVPPFPK